MVQIVFGEGMNSQMPIVGKGGEFYPSSAIQIVPGFYLGNTTVATCGYFL
jgi:hypothetical protein